MESAKKEPQLCDTDMSTPIKWSEVEIAVCVERDAGDGRRKDCRSSKVRGQDDAKINGLTIDGVNGGDVGNEIDDA